MRANAPQFPGGGWAQLELTDALAFGSLIQAPKKWEKKLMRSGRAENIARELGSPLAIFSTSVPKMSFSTISEPGTGYNAPWAIFSRHSFRTGIKWGFF